MSFAEKMKSQEEAAKKAGYAQTSGNWFKITEGDNVIRVLTEPEMIFEKYQVGICYTDCGYEGTPKFMCYVAHLEKGLDGEDIETVKLAKLPYKIGSEIAALENDEDYKFSEFPMPYKIKIKAKNAGTKDVDYKVMPSPKHTEISSEILETLKKEKPVTEIIEKMKENQKQRHIQDGTYQKNQERKQEIQQGIEDAKKNAGSSAMYEYPGMEGEEEINPEDIPF